MTLKARLLASAIAILPAGAIFVMDARADAIAALQEKQQALQEEAEGIVNTADEAGVDLDETQLARVTEISGEVAKIAAQISAREAIAKPAAGTGRKTAPEPGAGKTPASPAQVRPDARRGGFKHLGEFASCVRGAAMNDDGARTKLLNMNEGSGEDGGFIVPPEFSESIMKVVEGEDSLLSRTDGSVTARNSVNHPKDETTPWGTAGIRVYWEGEGQAPATRTGTKFKGDTLRLNKLFALVDVTDELLEDAPQLDNHLRTKAPEVMTSVINLAVISGNGVGKPLGFMNSPALITVAKETSQPADTIHHRNVVKMWSRMYAPCRARSVWLANQDVEPQFHLMSFRDGTSTPVPVYLPPGGLSASPYGTLMGRPVIPVQGMETLGDLGDLAFVDLTRYRALTKAGGMRTDTSIHLKFDTDEMVYRFIFRLAGAPWWSAPITPRDGNNTLSPFIALAERA